MGLDNDYIESLPTGYRINGVVQWCQNAKPTTGLTVGDSWYKPVDGSEWYWNGTYWLSKENLVVGSDYRETQISTSINLWGTAFSGRDLSSGSRAGIYFLNATNVCYQAAATDASNYWSFTFYALYSDGTVDTLVTHTTASKPSDSWFELRSLVNSAKNSLGKTTILIYASIAKIGTPSYLYAMSSVQLKWIHP